MSEPLLTTEAFDQAETFDARVLNSGIEEREDYNGNLVDHWVLSLEVPWQEDPYEQVIKLVDRGKNSKNYHFVDGLEKAFDKAGKTYIEKLEDLNDMRIRFYRSNALLFTNDAGEEVRLKGFPIPLEVLGDQNDSLEE